MSTAAEPRGGLAVVVSYPHLVSGVVAILLFVVLVIGDLILERARLQSRIAQLAPLQFTEKWKGEAAPRALLTRSDVLPLYGSSELIYDMPNRATDFFSAYPTGFTVAPLGDRGYPALTMAVGIASLGRALEGRKIVVSLSGTWFLGDDTEHDATTLKAHFSPLQAGDVIFYRRLPSDLTERMAREIMSHDPVPRDFPMLHAALACLARRCGYERLIPVFAPLWAMRTLLLRTEDYRRVAQAVDHRAPPRQRSERVDWGALEGRGDSLWRLESASNVLGIQDTIWNRHKEQMPAGDAGSRDTAFLALMEKAPKWTDLDILLATLKAVGARPLILNSPLKGVYWEYRGVTAAARQRYYRHFDSVAVRYGFPTVYFQERDQDPYFLSESRSHLSSKGWAVYDRIINAFQHDSLR